jgi:hypothetical protein
MKNHVTFKPTPNEVLCNNCLWEGTEEELETFVDLSDNDIDHDVQYFRGCPNCETDSYLMNIEN